MTNTCDVLSASEERKMDMVATKPKAKLIDYNKPVIILILSCGSSKVRLGICC